MVTSRKLSITDPFEVTVLRKERRWPYERTGASVCGPLSALTTSLVCVPLLIISFMGLSRKVFFLVCGVCVPSPTPDQWWYYVWMKHCVSGRQSQLHGVCDSQWWADWPVCESRFTPVYSQPSPFRFTECLSSVRAIRTLGHIYRIYRRPPVPTHWWLSGHRLNAI